MQRPPTWQMPSIREPVPHVVGSQAAGAYPIEAVRTMEIAERTEKDIDYSREFKPRRLAERPDVTNAISHATCTTAMDLNAAAIVAVTKSSRTVGRIAKYIPPVRLSDVQPIRGYIVS